VKIYDDKENEILMMFESKVMQNKSVDDENKQHQQHVVFIFFS